MHMHLYLHIPAAAPWSSPGPQNLKFLAPTHSEHPWRMILPYRNNRTNSTFSLKIINTVTCDICMWLYYSNFNKLLRRNELPKLLKMNIPLMVPGEKQSSKCNHSRSLLQALIKLLNDDVRWGFVHEGIKHCQASGCIRRWHHSQQYFCTLNFPPLWHHLTLIVLIGQVL